MRIHAPWDEDESSSGCPRGPRLQSTLIIELRALERESLDRTLEISLSVIYPLYDRVDAFSLYRGIRVSEKKNIEKNIHRFFNSSVFFPLIRTENYLLVRSTANEPLDPFSKNFYSESFEYLNLGSIGRNTISRWKIRKMRKGLKNIISLYIRGNVERVNIQLVSLPKTRWWANIISGQLNVATSQNDAITSTRPRRDKNSRYLEWYRNKVDV